MTIRQRLAAALVLALFPIFALAVLQAVVAYRTEAAEARAALVLSAERATERARARVETAAVLLQALGPRTVGLGCTPLLDDVSRRIGDYEVLIRFDRIGRVVCASGDVPAVPGRRDQPWFRALAAGAPQTVLAAPAGAFGDRRVVVVATRAERDGEFDGALLAAVRILSLEPERRGLPSSTEVGLLDGAGAFIGERPAHAVPPPAGWQARAGSDAVTWRAESLGQPRQYVLAPLVGGDVFAVLSAPDPGLLSLAWLDPVAILLLPLIAWAIAVIAVWIVAERIILRWLVYLERIAGLYAKGRFTVRPVQAENAPAEIRQLSRTLDQMAAAIVWRDQSLREALSEKDVLMREIHHRVKNNLQIITSLLNMQQRALADPTARAALSDTRQRITALAIIYRALYQSDDLKRVDIRLFLSELMGQLMSADARRDHPIRSELTADSMVIDPDKLAPFALFAVEAITNAQKHAFPDRAGQLDVTFTVGREEAVLEVADDGVGAPGDQTAGGVGRTLMTAFARQLRGRAETVARPGGGTVARLAFPLEAALAAPASPPVAKPTLVGNQAAA